MTTIYIVEKEKSGIISAARALMGDYAVRAFASLKALKQLSKIVGHAMPDIVIADLDDLEMKPGDIVPLLASVLPEATILLLSPDSVAKTLALCNPASEERLFVYHKPIDSLDLSRYVRFVLRSRGHRSGILRVRDVSLDFAKLQCQIFPDETPINLPFKEAQILKILMERPGECLSRDDLHKEVWPGLKVSARSIDSHISRLRKRLNSPSVDIVSKYGGGYYLELSK